MTNWLPDLNEGSGPLYLRLADRAETAIAAGTLPHGAKLPPQRNLAYDLGITVGTVGRAYSLLRQRGLVSGETGRGTFVQNGGTVPARPSSEAHPYSSSREIFVPQGKLIMDSTAAPDVGQAEALGRLATEITRDHPSEIASYTRRLPASWQEAGQRWLKVGSWEPNPSDVVPTLGGHAAILAVIAAVTAPGDRIAFEQLTYSSMARSANLIGRRSIAVGMDEFGPDPDDLERVCAQQHPKLLFLVPDLQNPTLTIMPEARRREIIDIARRHNVWLIEDAIYGALLSDEERPPSIAELAPERTFHVSSLSKSVAAGIRGGWVACPPHLAARVLTAQKMVTGGMPFLMSELAARLVLSGYADSIRQKVKIEIASRVTIARSALGDYDFQSHRCAPFLWLKLPEPWLSGTLRQAAFNEGVLIDDEDEFKSGRTEKTFHRVRIGFSAPQRSQVEGGFARILSLLDNGIAGYDSYG
ncbi:aminotransferase class I/II-fold pyridoxal phosphate-dependent enzyme [Mesorhizobium sp. NBSH29]|uniref:aminotransferase-like domain-containing protein n=1 Tax=Mesorhizobium sp. NBSH29 TaxID=2654249 RepID=UPI0018968654|nr:PLP-dependent aminotransferase family protein [Mesorhizobium sp. NBSH29]QPC88736.1 aminotransferase class I/II-fold pyridoxal phosphate-dependent enzyme [Mesorhizobium sp. NBSH29]